MKSLLVLAALFACVAAEVAKFSNCDEASDDVCEISEIRINPCKLNNQKNLCSLRKGKDAAISFDFTPKFAATKMKASLYWASDKGDIPFPIMHKADACPLTNCPVESGKKQELNYKLPLSKKLPNGFFTFKWKLYDEENEKQLCCFKTDIQLIK